MTGFLESVWTDLVPILWRKLDRLCDPSIYPFFTGPSSRLYYLHLISFVLIPLGLDVRHDLPAPQARVLRTVARRTTHDDYDSVPRIYLVPFQRAARLVFGGRMSR